MAISFTRYIDITSGVAGAPAVTDRQFMGRLFTTNELLPPKTLITFSNAAEVSNYFGDKSEEYERAAFYFGWVSKSFNKAQAISFARWVDADTAPIIFGAVKTQDLAFYQATPDGLFGITIGLESNNFTVNTTTATSLSDVATLIQAQINLAVGLQWTGAVVTYDAPGGYFKFVGGDAVDAVITTSAGAGLGVPITESIGWGVGATLSNGALTETITETLQESWDASNNFGTFLFMPALTIAEIEEAAVWTNLQNVRVMYTVPCTLLNYVAYRAALKNYGGVGLTLSLLAEEYPEQAPMMIFAATNYSAADSVQNYEFQQFALTPSVSDDVTADLLDSSLINYYGVTQQAGQLRAFYQTGVLQGLDVSPSAMNVYANEIWLKDDTGVQIMNLLLAITEIPANAIGCAQILTIAGVTIQSALDNGTISVGKLLDEVQKAEITQISGSDVAWQQVQTLGYWTSCRIESFTVGTATKFKAVITLIYSKDDVITKVTGFDILI